MKIAIIGFGVVGSGAYEAAKTTDGLEVVSILSAQVRPGYEHVKDMLVDNIEAITGNDEIELCIEAIGGTDIAREFVLACLKAGKHVVTPNKNLISAHYDELMTCAREHGVKLCFTPAAGGGIPWLFSLRRTRRTDSISEVRGIVNGTCNYILDAMHESGASFADMLKNAQELGYAERNPAADIEGTDTLRKTVISSNLAYGSVITEDQVPCYGIDTIDACDIAWFNEHGYTCKLMMQSKVNDGVINAYVEPTLFPQTALEANVKTNNNLITLTGNYVGTLSFYGQGAGQLPTGQSVIQDVLDIRDGIELAVPADQAELKVDNSKAVHKYYIRHDRICEHIEPLIESYEEKDGIYYCISKPITVCEMHAMGHHRKEKGRAMFFAGLGE